MSDDERVRDEFLRSARSRFAELKGLGDRALERLGDDDLRFTPDPESNSVAVLVQHVAGNMLSRWTDFLTTDGEKPTRNRDGEFVPAEGATRETVRAVWEKGWARLFETVNALTPADLDRRVSIRGHPHSVVDAIQRQLIHYGEHVGQIIYIAKHRKWSTWESLSIPRKR
jgi:Protein of unknown function (DUF1572)